MRRFDLVLFVLIFTYLLSGWTGFWGVEQSVQEPSALHIKFQPGFFEILRTESAFLDQLQDPLVESDSRPERLFDHVHRDFTQNLVLAITYAFLLVFTVLTAVAGLTKRWFYSRMKRMLFMP